MDSIFVQIGVVTIAAAGLAIVAKLLRQPIILAYIAAGILLGGAGLHLIHNPQATQETATIGIIFLLFLVGLELDIAKVKELGAVILTVGFAQMIVIGAVAFALGRVFGYPTAASVYLGLAAVFSSTAVALKRLADKQDMASLHAKITIGVLLLQDIVAIVALMFISGVGGGHANLMTVAVLVAKGGVLLAGTWFFSRFILPKVFFMIAKSTELLFLTSIAWAFLFALVARALGFSEEIGAFLAGLSLASLPYSLEIIGRVRPLKDFFLVMFFVVLGLEVSVPAVLHNLPLIAALTFVVVVVKSLVTSVAIVRSGYPARPAYLAGSALGQMSEFALLIALLGLSYGQISQEVVAVIASLMVVTITVNTYWNDLHKQLYPVFAGTLKRLGKHASAELAGHPKGLHDHVLLFGANRAGFQLLRTLDKLKNDVLVIDHNPVVIRRLLSRGVHSVYGDIDDFELLRDMGLDQANMVISTVPNVSASLYLIEQTRATNHKALIITTAEQIDEALSMYAAGADYVILPKLVGGEQAARILENVDADVLDKRSVDDARAAHIANLRSRLGELTV